jgi:hypothetical protein
MTADNPVTALLATACPVVRPAGELATECRSASAGIAIMTSTASMIMLTATVLMRFAAPSDMDSCAIFSIELKSRHVRPI